MHAAFTSEYSALARNIGIRCKSRADEPLRQTCIKTSRDGVFIRAIAYECTDFESRIFAISRRIPRRNHAELQASERG